MRQFRLRLSQRTLGVLALCQIKHEADALVLSVAERRRAEQNRHAAAVFAKVLLLESFATSRRPELCHGSFVRVAPFGGRQRGPAHTTRNDWQAGLGGLFRANGLNRSRGRSLRRRRD
jgi:hypothetical protein